MTREEEIKIINDGNWPMSGILPLARRGIKGVKRLKDSNLGCMKKGKGLKVFVGNIYENYDGQTVIEYLSIDALLNDWEVD